LDEAARIEINESDGYAEACLQDKP